MDALPLLRQSLIAAPVLAVPRSERYLLLETGTCDKQINCVPMKDHPHRANKPLWFCFRTLNAPEMNYDTTHCECQSTIWAILFLIPSMGGQDSQSVQTVMPLYGTSTSQVRPDDWPGRDCVYPYSSLVSYREWGSKAIFQTHFHDLKRGNPTRYCLKKISPSWWCC